MTTIKLCTDLEQSNVLAKILPLESADMHYLDDEFMLSPNQGSTIEDLQEYYGTQIIPCWSLVALFSVLPKGTRLFKSATDDTYHCDCPKYNFYKWFDNPIDACYKIILILHELNLL